VNVGSSERIKVFIVVEDDPDMRVLIAVTLAREPRLELVGEAGSAREALELLDTVEPGLIVLDHSIEGDMMGLEAAPLLKAKAPRAKILFFTAYDMRREAQAEASIDAYLRKDNINLLLTVVRELLDLQPV
jgi:DNA-binding NarL/FixJ family response regulator